VKPSDTTKALRLLVLTAHEDITGSADNPVHQRAGREAFGGIVLEHAALVYEALRLLAERQEKLEAIGSGGFAWGKPIIPPLPTKEGTNQP
jgi:hypothetical protein